MSALTKKEREGLEDVFLSIHSNVDKYQKLKEISSLMINNNHELSLRTLYKRAKNGIEENEIAVFFSNFLKKKKNLSK